MTCLERELTVMLSKSVVSLAFAASLMAAPAAFAQSDLPPPVAPAPMDQAMTGSPPPEEVTNGPQADAGDHSAKWSATRNVRESQRYDRLVATSTGFRHARERKECGPITDAELHSQCLASFGTGTESHMYGSSRPPRPIRNSSGASE
jgi:hypothetical protein